MAHFLIMRAFSGLEDGWGGVYLGSYDTALQ